eukprot:c28636_g1_i3 orf=396-1880(-)
MHGRSSEPSAIIVVLAAAAASLGLALASYLYRCYQDSYSSSGHTSTASNQDQSRTQQGVLGAIGNTPLIRICSLSQATGCEILAKAEFLNPGGSVKDRVALQIIRRALESGKLRIGGLVTEGSAGSTAISLAMVAAAYGCKCHVVIPDDTAIEKTQMLEALGATVERVRPVSITHKYHFVNIARRRAMVAEERYREKSVPQLTGKNGKLENWFTGTSDREQKLPSKPSTSMEMDGLECQGKMEENASLCLEDDTGLREQFSSSCKKGGCIHTVGGRLKGEDILYKDNGKGGYFADQFENLENFYAHYQGTGPEIWSQVDGKLHAFIAAAGTGGTIAGISRFLKEQNPDVKCYLIDPPGSGLFNRVTRGVLYTSEEAEGTRLKNPFDTIIEGIGINRLTENFKLALLDGAFRGTDREAVEMSRYLVRNDGLFVGSSSAMNCVGAVRVARLLGPGHTIVTILCDGGVRHLSRFYNPAYLSAVKLTPSANGLEFLDD